MNKKFSSLVASTVHGGDEKSGSGSGSENVQGQGSGTQVQVIKFKKLKIKQQKIKHDKIKDKSSGSVSSSGGLGQLLFASSSHHHSSSSSHIPSALEVVKKDLFLSSLLYSVNQSIMTIPTLPPFLLPDHFKSFLKFSLKSSHSNSLIPSFPFLCHSSSPLLLASSPSQDLNLSPPPTSANANVPSFESQFENLDQNVTLMLTLPTGFKIKEYAPIVFASLRDKVFSFHSRGHYKNSLFNVMKGPPIKHVPQVVQSSGQHEKHGHDTSHVLNRKLMYNSSDNLLQIKSIDGQEVEQLLSLLKSLHPYLVQRKSNVSKANVTATSADGSNVQQQPGSQQTLSVVNSLLPQYMAVYRLSYPMGHIHSLSSVVTSVSSAASSSGVKGIKGSTSESHSYVMILRNPLSSCKNFFPIHHTYHLNADGIKHVVGARAAPANTTSNTFNTSNIGTSTENNDFTLILKKEDADRLMTNLENDLKFLAAHLLVNYTLLIGVHSIDLWEQQLQEEADEELFDDEGEDDDGPNDGSLVQSITQQLKGLKAESSRGESSANSGSKSNKKPSPGISSPRRLSSARKESLSLVIDPIKHPFAIPSPFVSVDSRASSRPSLYSSEEKEREETNFTEFRSSTGSSTSCEGRFVYFVGFDDLIPLSASYSSKELDIDKVLFEKKKKDKESSSKNEKEGHKVVSTSETDKENQTHQSPSDQQEMGKKEAAREYSKNMMSQVKKRLRIIQGYHE